MELKHPHDEQLPDSVHTSRRSSLNQSTYPLDSLASNCIKMFTKGSKNGDDSGLNYEQQEQTLDQSLSNVRLGHTVKDINQVSRTNKAPQTNEMQIQNFRQEHQSQYRQQVQEEQPQYLSSKKHGSKSNLSMINPPLPQKQQQANYVNYMSQMDNKMGQMQAPQDGQLVSEMRETINV